MQMLHFLCCTLNTERFSEQKAAKTHFQAMQMRPNIFKHNLAIIF